VPLALGIVLATCFAILSMYCAFVIHRLFTLNGSSEVTSEWLENFSVAAYLPMEGLLADDDFAFLSRQPGFDLSLYRKLRRERLHIFRQYLTRLIVDFNRLHLAARVLIAHLPNDNSELFGRLLRNKIRFSFLLLKVEFSYTLCFIGLGTISVKALIQHLDEMNAQFLDLAAAAA
jgi:hypothetical protein